MKMRPRKLPSGQPMPLQRLQPPATATSSTPPAAANIHRPLAQTFPAALPTLSVSSPNTSETQLLTFLKSHLKTPVTPQNLLHFLKNRLHYHPKFTHLDFRIFQWATTIDSFRHDHHTYEWMVRTLAISDRFEALRLVLIEGQDESKTEL